MTKQPEGLIVSVYRNGRGDCTNNGESSCNEDLLLHGEGIAKVFEAIPDKRPAATLMVYDTQAKRVPVRRPYDMYKDRWYYKHLYLYVVPDSLKGRYTMFGGNYVHCSDSRLRDICPYPLPVHDRVE